MQRLSLVVLFAFVPMASAAAQVDVPRIGGAEVFIAFCCTVAATALANSYVFSLLRTTPREAASKWSVWAGKWELPTYQAFSWRKLILWSLLSLFMELLMIRWISSEIRIFAYFKNFVLIACFLGFGLGCYLSRRTVNLLVILIPLLTLTTLIALPWNALRLAMSELPSFVAASSGTQVWGIPSGANWILLVVAIVVIVPLFGLIVGLFIPIGQVVGRYLETAPRGILAYSVNVAAAIAGIFVYSILCFWYQPPASWFAVAGVLLVVLVWNVPRLRWISVLVFFLCIALLSMRVPKNTKIFWSPYQKLTLLSNVDAGQVTSYLLRTNGTWYQKILDLSPEFVRSHPAFFRDHPIEWNAYNVPYRFFPNPPSVLILGSGMGNDVAAALRNGASQITAVEIDPLILELGENYHPEKPYSSSDVLQIRDDARHYIQNSADQFDLIVFSLLDSHTTTSSFTNIRIDNYVYTREALQAAKRLLKPEGVFIVKFQVDTPWIAGRLHELLQEVFGEPPLQLKTDYSEYTMGGMFFITGAPRQIGRALSDPLLAQYVSQHSEISMAPATPTTDDWPYFYQRGRGVPMPIIMISAVLIFLCGTLLRHTGTELRLLHWHFFFLGAGFLLLEAQIISKMALLFGTTWLVNSVVITALLLFVLAANVVTAFASRFPLYIAYAGLFVTLTLSYLIPLRDFSVPSVWLTAINATLVLALPVFFASIVFIRSFAKEGFRSEALGSNLLGAMLGGLLESVSMWTGIRSLLLLAAALYALSWVALWFESLPESSRQAELAPARAPID